MAAGVGVVEGREPLRGAKTRGAPDDKQVSEMDAFVDSKVAGGDLWRVLVVKKNMNMM